MQCRQFADKSRWCVGVGKLTPEPSTLALAGADFYAVGLAAILNTNLAAEASSKPWDARPILCSSAVFSHSAIRDRAGTLLVRISTGVHRRDGPWLTLRTRPAKLNALYRSVHNESLSSSPGKGRPCLPLPQV